MRTFIYETTLVTEVCCSCGVLFAMPIEMQARRRDDRASFYCPAGHAQHYIGKTEAEKQRERAERLERSLANRDEDLRAERASHAATKGQLTKTRKRIGNGVCPCCNRHFTNVERHMKSQHPEAVS